MDMAIVSAPALPAGQSKSSSNASDSNTAATSGSNGQFGQTLAGSMKGQGSTSTATGKTEGSATTATGQSAATQQAGTVEQLTAEQLVAAIGEILQGLQDNADQQQTDNSNAQDALQQMLDQLNAMLTLLGQQPVQPLPQVPGFEVEDLKADVAQALVQLQQTIDRGQLGSAKLGNSLEWISSQLNVLGQSMQQLKETQSKQVGSQEDEQLLNSAPQTSSTSQAAPAAVQTTVTVKAVSLLDQLNRNAVSPNLLQVIAGQQQPNEQSDEPTVSTEDAPVAINLSTQQATDAARTLMTARTVQVPQQVPAQQFAETMANLMVNKFEVKTAVGMSEAKLTLTPEHLGQVDVRISVQNGQLTALFITDTSAAKDMLDNQLALLRANLQSQGLNVEKLEVSQQSFDSQMAQQQGSGSGRQQSENGSGASEGGETEQSAFEAELTEQTVIRGLGYGRGINVQA